MTPLALDQLRWIAYALLVVSVFLAGLAVPQFIKARRAPYYAVRRKALRRATRWLLVTLVVQGLAVIMLVVVPHLVSIVSVLAPIPTATPSCTPTPAYIPLPTSTPTATPTRRPTATPPLIPTFTPAVPLPDAALSPLPSAVPAGEDARIELQYVAFGRDDQSVEPGSEFPPGDYRVYLYFTYAGMQDGVATTFAWYKDGEFDDFCSDTWAWGWVEGREWGERGRQTYYCKLREGWEPGEYEIHVFIETRLQGVTQFVITEE